MEYQDLIYNYYSFNEIGQPLFLEKTDNVVLYSVRYRAGYTVYEKSTGGESGGEVEDTKWPRILKSKFLAKKTPVERQGASWVAEAIDPDGIKLKVSVNFKDNFKTINYEEKIFKEYMYEYKYIEKNIKGGILVLDNSNKPSEVYSLDMISDYCDSGKLRILKIYSIIGNFMPISAEKEKFMYRIDNKYNEETKEYERSFFYDEKFESKEVKDFRWDGDTRSGITVIKTCILKSEAYKDLLFLLKKLADKQYYILDSESLVGWIKESDIEIISPDKKVPHWSNVNSVNTNFKSMTFGSKDGFIIKEAEDRFFIYFIFKDLLYSSGITFYEENKGLEVYVHSGNTRNPAYKAKIKTDENGFEIVNELKQEDLELSFDIDLDDRNQKQ